MFTRLRCPARYRANQSERCWLRCDVMARMLSTTNLSCSIAGESLARSWRVALERLVRTSLSVEGVDTDGLSMRLAIIGIALAVVGSSAWRG